MFTAPGPSKSEPLRVRPGGQYCGKLPRGLQRTAGADNAGLTLVPEKPLSSRPPAGTRRLTGPLWMVVHFVVGSPGIPGGPHWAGLKCPCQRGGGSSPDTLFTSCELCARRHVSSFSRTPSSGSIGQLCLGLTCQHQGFTLLRSSEAKEPCQSVWL